MRILNPKIWRAGLWMGLIIILGLAGWFVGFWLAEDRSPITFGSLVASDSSTEVTPAKSAALSSRLLFMGDTYWGRDVNKYAQASPLKEAYPFSRLSSLDRSKYDGWIANLECPSVPGVNQPYSLEVNSLLFNCPTKYLGQAAKWFTAFSQANNHSANQNGRVGIDATRASLKAAGIQYFGDFDPEKLDDVCEVITVGAHLNQSGGTATMAQIPIAMCGYHGLSSLPSAKSLAVMKQYTKYMPVFAYPHMGVEYTAKPTPAQVTLYRQMIDNGADAVFGGHPHWVQPSEVYKNKLIVYSMGDFMFDQPPGETQRGAAIDLTMSMPAGATTTANLDAWTKLAASCKSFHDSCLANAKKSGLSRLPFTLRYNIVGIASTKTPGIANAADTKLILDRLGWASVGPKIYAVK